MEPPKQWKDWGIVGPHVVWRLQKAVYGLRQSPKWWSDKRDADLRRLRIPVAGKEYVLRQNEADSQVWTICTSGQQLLGVVCVYVDDFLIMAHRSQLRTAVVNAITSLWTFGTARTLSPSTSITFLGIDWSMRANGDIVLSQERFVRELLVKHKMDKCNPIKAILHDKPPEVADVPTPEVLTELQAYAGSFNWLATRTRPDLAYYVSLLASSASRQAAWSQGLARKVLRYLAGTAEAALTMSAQGDEDDMRIYTDAGFAGPDTKSQNGMVICWGGSIITWRSSRGALSALSTAEAELCSAALGWQVGEGVRYFLSTLSIFPARLEVLIDNRAALTTASLGATWRTRYYAVRAHRLLQEHQAGKIILTYCPTKVMVADALTKLAGGEVITILLTAMDSRLPTRLPGHSTSATPGPSNRGDIAGDGPAVQDLGVQTARGHLPRNGLKARAPPHHLASGSAGTMATGSGERPRAAAASAPQPTSQEVAPKAGQGRAARAAHSSRPPWRAAHLELLHRRRRALAKAAGVVDLTRPEPRPGLPPFTGAPPSVPTGLWADGDPASLPPRQQPQPAEASDDDDWGGWTAQSAPSAREHTGGAPATPPWRKAEPQGEAPVQGRPGSSLAPAAHAPSPPSKAPALSCAYRRPPVKTGHLPPECVQQPGQQQSGPPRAPDIPGLAPPPTSSHPVEWPGLARQSNLQPVPP